MGFGDWLSNFGFDAMASRQVPASPLFNTAIGQAPGPGQGPLINPRPGSPFGNSFTSPASPPPPRVGVPASPGLNSVMEKAYYNQNRKQIEQGATNYQNWASGVKQQHGQVWGNVGGPMVSEATRQAGIDHYNRLKPSKVTSTYSPSQLSGYTSTPPQKVYTNKDLPPVRTL